MNLDLDITKNFNLKKVRLNLTTELNEAGKIIRRDHFARLERGMGVEGPMKDLADSTIEAKGFNQILVNEGKMRNLEMERATKTKQFVILYPGKKQKRNGVTNQQIGAFHQEGGPNLPKREWFGVTRDAEKRSLKLVEFKINRILRSA